MIQVSECGGRGDDKAQLEVGGGEEGFSSLTHSLSHTHTLTHSPTDGIAVVADHSHSNDSRETDLPGSKD